jgi:hypothetical protein
MRSCANDVGSGFCYLAGAGMVAGMTVSGGLVGALIGSQVPGRQQADVALQLTGRGEHQVVTRRAPSHNRASRARRLMAGS